MSAVEAKRTLVKSPPEVWDRVSDLSALAECLGAFGEIRITRTQPETLVEWEGELATGSVRLESSGWGTKVVLTAEVPEPVVVEPVAAEPAVVAEPVVEAPADCIEEQVEEPPAVALEPEPEPEAVAEPEPEPAKQGWFARWRERRAAKRVPAETDGREMHAMRAELVTPEPEPLAPETEPTATTPEPALAPTSHVPEPAPVPVAPEPEPTPKPEPSEPHMTHDDALGVLNSTLDHLGAAHHRPFSRG